MWTHAPRHPPAADPGLGRVHRDGAHPSRTGGPHAGRTGVHRLDDPLGVDTCGPLQVELRSGCLAAPCRGPLRRRRQATHRGQVWTDRTCRRVATGRGVGGQRPPAALIAGLVGTPRDWPASGGRCFPWTGVDGTLIGSSAVRRGWSWWVVDDGYTGPRVHGERLGSPKQLGPATGRHALARRAPAPRRRSGSRLMPARSGRRADRVRPLEPRSPRILRERGRRVGLPRSGIAGGRWLVVAGRPSRPLGPPATQ